MKADFAFLCDYAEATAKINALGIGFDTIYAPHIPFKYPHFTLVVQLRSSVAEAGQKDIKVHLVDADGKNVMPVLSSRVDFKTPQSGRHLLGRFVIEFGNVEFKRHGAHSVDVSVDGLEVASVGFNVSPPPTGSK